ncbi:MAG: hypothetical protein JNM63_06065 [Spirochaetia bacterium]|nr:hypothetical protein [Spirochaetia bacterium]
MSLISALEIAAFLGMTATGTILSIQDFRERSVGLLSLVLHAFLTLLFIFVLLISKKKGIFWGIDPYDPLISGLATLVVTGTIHAVAKERFAIGDVFFFTISSALIPPLVLPLAFFLTSSLGLGWYLVMRLRSRDKSKIFIPTVPFIFVSFMTVFVWRNFFSALFDRLG